MPTNPIIWVVVGIITAFFLMSNVSVSYIEFTVDAYDHNEVSPPKWINIKKPLITSFLEKTKPVIKTSERAEVFVYDNQVEGCFNDVTKEHDYEVCGLYKEEYYGIDDGKNIRRLDFDRKHYFNIVIEVKVFEGDKLYAKNSAQYLYDR